MECGGNRATFNSTVLDAAAFLSAIQQHSQDLDVYSPSSLAGLRSCYKIGDER
jgi:hypothetical protein